MMKYHVLVVKLLLYIYSCRRQTNPMLAQWTAKIVYDRNDTEKGPKFINFSSGTDSKKSVEWLTKKKTVQILEKLTEKH